MAAPPPVDHACLTGPRNTGCLNTSIFTRLSIATQQFQAVEAASELERCWTSRAELQLALEEEKQTNVRMRLANDEMLAELRQFKARAEMNKVHAMVQGLGLGFASVRSS